MQTPRHLIVSYHTAVWHTLTTDALVGHSDPGPVSFPLNLPVTAAGQALPEQDLGPVVKPVGVIGIWLLLSALGNSSVPIRDNEEFVGCVEIQCKLTCIWW